MNINQRNSDLFVYSMDAVVCQVDPADLGGIMERFCCQLGDVVVLQVQVVCSEWDGRDHTDVPVLTVESIWIDRGA